MRCAPAVTRSRSCTRATSRSSPKARSATGATKSRGKSLAPTSSPKPNCQSKSLKVNQKLFPFFFHFACRVYHKKTALKKLFLVLSKCVLVKNSFAAGLRIESTKTEMNRKQSRQSGNASSALKTLAKPEMCRGFFVRCAKPSNFIFKSRLE